MQRESAPLVSIITPCYKGGKYLPFSIASVLQQDFKDFELLLIDDKSPDNTREIMQNNGRNQTLILVFTFFKMKRI